MLELNTSAVLLLLWITGRNRRFRRTELLEASVARDRRDNDGMPPPSMARTLDVSQRSVGGVRCYRLAAPGATPQSPQVMHLHGGAHCTQISKQHWLFLEDLALRTGCVVHVPLFPLTPEASHRTVIDGMHEVWRVHREDSPTHNWVLMGDSSGGGLALSLTQEWVRLGMTLPRSLVLISPWLDVSLRHALQAMATVDDPWLALPGMQLAADWWAGGADVGSEPVSPLYGPLGQLPPTTLFIGTRDLLVSECRALLERARQCGWALECVEGPGMIHVWPILPVREARSARSVIASVVSGTSAANEIRFNKEELSS